MPVEFEEDLVPGTADEFDDVDYSVMGLAYEIQNEMGRLWDEEIFKNELEQRIRRKTDYDISKEVMVRVLHDDFEKRYYLDLLINKSFVIETKAVESLTKNHEKQVINYLLLCGLQHSKLINFRPERVDGKRIQTRLNPETRKQFNILDDEWDPMCRESNKMRRVLKNLLNDWGTFLDVHLYRRAIVELLGGPQRTLRLVPVKHNSNKLGRQQFCLLNERVAFEITSLTKNQEKYRKQLSRELKYTDLT